MQSLLQGHGPSVSSVVPMAPVVAPVVPVQSILTGRLPILKPFTNDKSVKGIKASTFMSKYDKYMSAQTDANKLNAFSSFLEERPLQWLMDLEERNAPELATWQTLKAAFLALFVVKDSAGTAYQKLCSRLQKSDESIEDFIAVYEQLASDASEIMTERLRIQHFLDNMDMDIRAVIGNDFNNKTDRTVNEVYVAAKDADHIVQQRKRRQSNAQQTIATSSTTTSSSSSFSHNDSRNKRLYEARSR